MFHLPCCINPESAIKIDEFRDAPSAYTAHPRSLDLVEWHGPIRRRQCNTIVDTDDERDYQFSSPCRFVTLRNAIARSNTDWRMASPVTRFTRMSIPWS